MKVTGVGWVGVKTGRYEEMVAFFTDVLGLPATGQEAETTVLRLPTGGALEIFGPGAPHPKDQFGANEVVIGLFVDNIEEASAELAAAGVELVGPLEYGEGGYAWQHFRSPDGKAFELSYDPARGGPTV